MSTGIQPPPAALAREAFRLLSVRKIPPTPENFARLYAETGQIKMGEVIPAIAVLEAVARDLRTDAKRGTVVQQLGHDLTRAIEKSDWEGAKATLRTVLGRLGPAGGAAPVAAPASATAAAAAPGRGTNDALVELRDLANRTLTFLVDTRLGYAEEAAAAAREVGQLILAADSAERVREAGSKLKQLWVRCELRGEGPEPQMRALHGLLLLLLRNFGDMSAEDKWLAERVEAAKEMLAGPLTPKSLAATERNFKECAYRQSAIRQSIEESKTAIRDMMAAFMDRLGEAVATTGGFSTRLTEYAGAVRRATDLRDLSHVLETLIADTNLIQAGIRRSHEELDSAHRQVQMYEQRVAALEAKLVEAQHVEREDPVTRLLNRRGLEEQYQVEDMRARRSVRPLCVVVAQIDEFRVVGDLLGAAAANAALQHFAGVLSGTIRPTDTLGRYGNEVFVGLFPEADAAALDRAIGRVADELVRKPLVWNDAEVALTFSFGVTARRAGDTFEGLIERADGTRRRALAS